MKNWSSGGPQRGTASSAARPRDAASDPSESPSWSSEIARVSVGVAGVALAVSSCTTHDKARRACSTPSSKRPATAASHDLTVAMVADRNADAGAGEDSAHSTMVAASRSLPVETRSSASSAMASTTSASLASYCSISDSRSASSYRCATRSMRPVRLAAIPRRR